MPSGDTLTSLIRRARRGDRNAYVALARTYLRPAYAVALAIVCRPQDAESIAENALCTTLKQVEECRVASRFPSLLLESVRKEARGFLHQGLSCEAANAGARQGRGSPQDWVTPERLELLSALIELDQRSREVVLLHDLAGWSLWQLAEALNTDQQELRQRLFHAQRLVRAKLMAEHDRG